MRRYVKTMMIIALFLVSLGGLLLHLRVHPISKHVYGYIPFIAGVLSALVIPLLFIFRKTLNLAYILNGFLAIIGTITMVHFSIIKAPLIPDIFILWCKFLLGRIIFCFEVYQVEAPLKSQGWRWIRYPNMGFWYVHLILLSLVYYLGNLLWR